MQNFPKWDPHMVQQLPLESEGSGKRSEPESPSVGAGRKRPLAFNTTLDECSDKRLDQGEQMIDLISKRSKDRKKQKEEEMKFGMLHSLMAKLVLDEFVADMYKKLREEFSNNDQPLYGDDKFRRRFRMRKPLFMKIVNQLSETDRFFQQHPDASMRLGASAMQKCTTAIRMLAYDCAADQVDEYLKLGATTARHCITHFVDGVIREFSAEYLRKPTPEDMNRLLREGVERGFPGMLGSIDCMHWEWKNCPAGWKGMYQGRSKTATVILEAVASWDLWIWHALFGTPGSCNDINVLQRSPVFDDILNGRAPQFQFTVNGNTYNQGYYLTDEIYPKWETFIDAITTPQTPKQRLFTTKQESIGKDVERAFGVLQARFAIIRRPALAWSVEMLWKIIMACIIMHNMIVKMSAIVILTIGS
ncbi:uncharacterized protein LOC110720250 [Chenopodium quinoa]|uniref:uncharacterized protein LOC110720250 n=1 Tax=Chenopodium quinoa TaxID=63459 RepID=UPI000B7869A4|nr:uncharacterized protein LOC110720250 [Chenopodium quinoa]